MRDPYANTQEAGGVERVASAAHRESENALQQALRALGGRTGLGESALSPEALSELARRAGVSSPSQIADLSRIMGVGAGAAGAPQVPQHILFALADIECAFPAQVVQGVERIGDITPVPNVVSWVLGVVQVWGTIVSVVDLRGFFGLPAQPLSPRSRLLVVTRNQMTIGFIADAVTEMRSLANARISSDGSGRIPDWIQPFSEGAALVDGRTVVLLDADRLLFSEQLHRYRTDF